MSPKTRFGSSMLHALACTCIGSSRKALLWLAFVLWASAVSAVTDGPTRDKVVHFNIPQQRADLALTQFAEQADLTLLFPSGSVEEYTANKLVGRYPVGEAIELLLRGTGLKPTFKNKLVLDIAFETKKSHVEESMAGQKKSRKGLLAAIISVFSSVGTTFAIAQGEVGESGNYLEEVIVTAQKRSQKLEEVPFSIQAFGAKQLQESNIRDLSEVIQFVPGASEGLSNTIGKRRYQIRGIEQGSGGATVGYYIDDAATYGVAFAPVGRSFDMERVEVLRGPQSTLYGNGSMGGTIRFITNAPNLTEIEAGIRAGYTTTQGGDPGHYVDAVVSLPLVEDVLALRLVGSTEQVGGYHEDFFGNKDVNDGEVDSFRASLWWQATDDLVMKFLYNRNDADQQGGTLMSSLDPTIAFGFGGFNNTGFELYSGTLEYDLGFATFNTTTTYAEADTEIKAVSPFPLSPNGLLTANSSVIDEVLSNETRLVSTSDGAFQWLVGLFYTDIETTANVNLDPPIIPPGTTVNQSDSIAYFAELSWDLMGGKLIPLIGVRYFEEKLEGDTAISAGFISGREFDSVNGRFNLSWNPNEAAHYYLNVAEGFRSGSFNLGLGCNFLHSPSGLPCEKSIDSDQLISYELGTKQTLADNQLIMDIALYFQDWENVRQFVSAGGLSLEYQVGDAEVYGIDLGISYSPTAIEGLSLQLSANWNSAEYVSINPVVSAVMGANKGDRIALVPEWTMSLMASYSWMLAGNWRGMANLSLSHIEPQFGQFGRDAREGGARDLLRARIGAETGRLGIFLFGNNLLGEDEAIYRPFIGGAETFTQDYPRQLGIEINYHL